MQAVPCSSPPCIAATARCSRAVDGVARSRATSQSATGRQYWPRRARTKRSERVALVVILVTPITLCRGDFRGDGGGRFGGFHTPTLLRLVGVRELRDCVCSRPGWTAPTTPHRKMVVPGAAAANGWRRSARYGVIAMATPIRAGAVDGVRRPSIPSAWCVGAKRVGVRRRAADVGPSRRLHERSQRLFALSCLRG